MAERKKTTRKPRGWPVLAPTAIPPELMQRLINFRFSGRYKTQADALRDALERGLDVVERNKPE